MRLWLLPVLVLLLAALAACEDPQSVGLPCVLVHPPLEGEAVIESASLDCQSRLCLQTSVHAPAMCTADCGEVGSSCTPESSELCTGSFRCEVPFTVGPFAGRALCVCDVTGAQPHAHLGPPTSMGLHVSGNQDYGRLGVGLLHQR